MYGSSTLTTAESSWLMRPVTSRSAAEMSRSASWAAAYAVASQAPDAAQLVHAAKSYVGEAVAQVAAETVQMHGGIAITWEHDAHLVFKRAHALGQLFGAPHVHRAALALP